MKYKQRIIRICLVIYSILSTTFSFGQQQGGYTLHGKIVGLKENEKVLMSLVAGLEFQFERRDSAYVKNGEFFIKGYVPEGPRDYWLSFSEHSPRVVQLTIDNGESISINCSQDISKIRHSFLQHYMTIDGSPSNMAMNAMLPALTRYRQTNSLMYGIIQRLQDSIGFNPVAMNPLFALKGKIDQNNFLTFFKTPEPDLLSAVPAIALSFFDTDGRMSYWKFVYDSCLTTRAKNSFYGKMLGEKVRLSVGQPFPEFNLSNIEGKAVILKDVLTKGKLTLVQFWASNSYNIDKFQEELQAMYKKYQSKGLNIVGISADTDAKKWKIAAADLPWVQVSDLKGRGGVVGTIYHEYDDPKLPNTTNVLIGPDGKIVAWDVRGPELQWYLWKTFGE